MAHATTLSRRALLAISAAAAAGTASCTPMGALAQAAAPNPDAALLELCSQWEAVRRECQTADDAFNVAEAAAVEKHEHLGMPALWSEVFRDPAYQEAEEWRRAGVARSHVLFQEIAQTRAVTLKGVMAKANVTLGECLEGIDAELVESTEGIVPGFMAISLVRDLLALNSAGAA